MRWVSISLSWLVAALSFVGCGEVRKGEMLSCTATRGDLTFEYSTTLLAADGSRFVSCEIIDLSASYSHSQVYLAGRQGAKTGGCQVVYDLDTSSGGYWSFSMDTMAAEYKDQGSPSDAIVVRFPETSCTH